MLKVECSGPEEGEEQKRAQRAEDKEEEKRGSDAGDRGAGVEVGLSGGKAERRTNGADGK